MVEATDPMSGSANGGGAGSHAANGARGRDPERGWRDLAGNTPTIVGVSGALRARDIARPTPEDLAAAELEVSVVRRDWKPPADAPAFNAKPGKPRR
jgi:hypothetical protein